MHNQQHTEEAKAKMRAARLGKPAPWKRRETRVVDGVTLYRCGRCAGFFPADGFYKNARTLLGLKSECKACHIATNIASRDKDKARESNAKYMSRARLRDPLKFRERERQRVRPVDEKVLARRAVNEAVRADFLVRPDECSSCGAHRPLHGHHDDYSKPLAVRWLCSACHGRAHRISFRRIEQEAAR